MCFEQLDSTIDPCYINRGGAMYHQLISRSIDRSKMKLVSAACSVLHVSSIVLLALLLSATAAAPVNGDTTSSNATAQAAGGGNSSSPPATVAGDITDMYLCHMCLGRDMLSRRVCPGYWPDCHANCDWHPSPGALTGAAPTGTPGSSTAVPNDDDPCYVVKIFQNGTYAIAQYLDCSRVRWCSLTCGGGDVAAVEGGRARASGGAAATSPVAPAPASLQRMLPPHVAEMQVCNTQVTARARARAVPLPPRGA